MHVQPQLGRHGQVTNAKILMRWPQADGSMIAPSLFMPITEETGLIVKLGDWALRQAGQHFALSVNVSPAQFRQPDFAARVRAALDEHGAPPSALVMELTEALLVDKRDAALARICMRGRCRPMSLSTGWRKVVLDFPPFPWRIPFARIPGFRPGSVAPLFCRC